MANRDPRLQAIACFTLSGRTAEMLSAVRPRLPVFAFSANKSVLQALSLRAAIVPVVAEEPRDTDSMIEMIDRHLQNGDLVPRGAPVLIVAAGPIGEGRTNLLKYHVVGL